MQLRVADSPRLIDVFVVEARAALHHVQDHEHRQQHEGYKRRCTHVFSPWLCASIEGAVNPDRNGSHADDVDGRKQTQHEWKDELHADLAGTLFGFLPSPGSRGARVRAQRLRHARAEAVRLHQHCDESADVFNAGSIREVLKRFEPRFSSAYFGRDNPQLFGYRRM